MKKWISPRGMKLEELLVPLDRVIQKEDCIPAKVRELCRRLNLAMKTIEYQHLIQDHTPPIQKCSCAFAALYREIKEPPNK